MLNGKYISGGVARVRYTHDTRQAITQHGKLLAEVKTQIKLRLKAHKVNEGLRHVELVSTTGAPKPVRPPGRKVTTRKQGCRHHVRKATDVPPSPQTQAETTDTDATVHEHKRQSLDAWRHADTLIYNKGNACTGGSCEITTHTGLSATITVASINIRGLNDAKLELILQSIVAEERDKVFIIDT